MRLSSLLLLTALSLSTLRLAAADTHEYSFSFANCQDSMALLAYHYGDKQYIADTLQISADGKALAKGDSVLPSGLYMIVFPGRGNEYFEFIVSEPKFSATCDLNNIINSMEFKGSKENKVFYDDLRFLQKRREQSEPFNQVLSSAEPGSPEALNAIAELDKLNEEVKTWRAELMGKNPDLLYTKILKALEEIELPEPPRNEQGQIIDSFFQFHYARKHGLKNLDWSDERLLRTPVIFNVMDRYLNTLSYRLPDSISASADNILKMARANEEIFKFCLVWLLNEYANSNIMGMDAVYVHLALNYYAKGEATWLDEAQLFRITDRAKRMQPTLIGRIAPNIIMKDVNGTTQNLYSIKNKYTIVYFWDPDCNHCQKETPVLKTAIDEIKGRHDVQVFAVNTQLELDKWLKFIDKHKLDGWHHVADFDQTSNFRALYDISATPVLYLLDGNKQIMAKRLAADQLGDFLDTMARYNKP